ncbi:MAG: hypothetical protein KatS3mg108_2675 [Isosphaeraceae bacterium]|jgi:putative membrane-bound dehydrogenase-like protein|nr:MAG: hypothetical protein KatS3mg108_2675 [Isosphaeraceae bacterium]
MGRGAWRRLVLAGAAWLAGWPGIEGGEVVIAGRLFRVADGFTVERVAGPPLVDRPITIDFDERGRLYVAESSGTNDPVEKQLADLPHRILRLEDSDGDGVFDRRTVFADRMMFPEGTMWYAGSLYVAAPPQIWKLTDTDDDGVAERREIWFDGQTLTGCANDLHGPYLGRDGLIYWCKGAFAEQIYERPGKPAFKTRAAHILRRRADGTGPIEPVMTGGMDNPVDVVFLPNGERIFSTTFLVHPGGGQRDGLIHAIPGALYGKVHDPLFDPAHRWTAPEVMPPLVLLGPAAPAGLALYESAVFGPEYRHNLFAALFNLHKVTRHVLHERGSTYEAATEDFLLSPDVDFHPTDVLEDADGSLLVVDTGGWYKLCCPTSQLHKPDVLGAIYRVRRLEASVPDDPRGRRIDWAGLDAEGLVGLLDDPRPGVVRRAIETLAARPPDATLPVLQRRGVSAGSESTAEERLGIVWTASRIDDPRARSLLGSAASDVDPTVRTAARNALALLGPEGLQEVRRSLAQDHGREADADSLARQVLADGSEIVRRLGAELVGRGGGAADVPAVLEALARDNDRPLDHALTYALIEIAAPGATADGLDHWHPRVRRAAMVALDQMGASDRLNPVEIAGWLEDADAELRASAAWVIGRHPEWGSALHAFYRARLARPERVDQNRSTLVDQLARLSGSEAIRSLLAETVADGGPAAVIALEAMARSSIQRVPAAWSEAIAAVLAARPPDPERLRFAISAVRGREFDDPALRLRLETLGGDAALSDSLRLAALAAIAPGLKSVDPALFEFLTSKLDPAVAVSERLTAADVLARSRLSDEQRVELAARLARSGPLDAVRLLPAFAGSGSEAVGRALLDALKASELGGVLRNEQLDPILKDYPASIRDAVRAWIASNQVGLAEQAARIDQLLRTLPPGDPGRGHQVFSGSKAACLTCHATGYVGGKIGPDLTRIGEIRTERDLLEAIVYPSASFVRSYEPVTVATSDGRLLNGIVERDTTTELVLRINADQVEHIARDAIEEIRPGTVSIMPAGLDQQLTAQELADLIAFLKTSR